MTIAHSLNTFWSGQNIGMLWEQTKPTFRTQPYSKLVSFIMNPKEIPSQSFSKTIIFDSVILKNFIVNKHWKVEKIQAAFSPLILIKSLKATSTCQIDFNSYVQTSSHSKLVSSNEKWQILHKCLSAHCSLWRVKEDWGGGQFNRLDCIVRRLKKEKDEYP